MKTLLETARALCEDAGFDPEVVTDSHLEAALRRRQRALGCSEAAYAARVGEPAEREEILEELLVRESWFYRDHAPFSLLTELAATRWLRHPGTVRALSAPCASGEEPYSIAMALAAGGVATTQLAVDAMDLSRHGLAAAALAHYPDRALARLPEALREKWVRPGAAGTQVVCEELRQVVRFHHGNLLALPAQLHTAPYQVVFCRNALIYLQPRARAMVLDALCGLLAPDGVLVVGHAETGLLRGRPFKSLQRAGTFAFEHAALSPSAKPAEVRPRPAPTAPSRRAPRARPVATAAVEEASLPTVTSLLEQARALADRGAYAAAAAQVNDILQRQVDNAEAQHLLGLIRAAEGDTAQARRCFQRALYLEPAHLPSLQHLALLAANSGDASQARLLLQRAARLESGT